MIRFDRLAVFGVVLPFLCSAACTTATADEPTRRGGWTITHDELTRRVVHTMEMTLYPQAEPRPALKYRLIPDEFDMVDGNAVIHYLKAMGFLEQNQAILRLNEIWRDAGRRSMAEGKHDSEFPPFSWQSMTPAELPLDEVKKYLEITAFQPRFLREAAKRRTLDMNRNIRACRGSGIVYPARHPIHAGARSHAEPAVQSGDCRRTSRRRHCDPRSAVRDGTAPGTGRVPCLQSRGHRLCGDCVGGRAVSGSTSAGAESVLGVCGAAPVHVRTAPGKRLRAAVSVRANQSTSGSGRDSAAGRVLAELHRSPRTPDRQPWAGVPLVRGDLEGPRRIACAGGGFHRRGLPRRKTVPDRAVRIGGGPGRSLPHGTDRVPGCRTLLRSSPR